MSAGPGPGPGAVPAVPPDTPAAATGRDAPTSRWVARPSGGTTARTSALLMAVALTTWLAFSSGGFFASDTAIATVVLVIALLLLTMLPSRPLAYVSPAGMVAIGAMVLFTVWTLASGQWSGAPTRTLHEYQRSLLYMAVLVLFACLPYGSGNARWLIRLIALSLGAATLAGLTARLDPTIGEALSAPADERLSWPLGYWNALGLAGALATIACLSMSSDLAERRPVRVLAAAAVPALSVAVYLTLSRGGILAEALGVVALLLFARGRGTPGTLLAVAPLTGFALLEAYDATGLTDEVAGDAASASAGSAVARTVLMAVVGTAILRVVALSLDARIGRARLWRPLSPAGTALVVVAVVLAGVVGASALGLGQRIAEQYEQSVASDLPPVADKRDRLRQASANGRLEHWEVSIEAFRDAPLIGHGAGTYARDWARERPAEFQVRDGHSLYAETLGELGAIGLTLLVVALLTPLVAMLARRRRHRVLWSAVAALYLAWLVRAGIDWDWEMPALTLPVFALAGAACARDTPRAARATGDSRTLRLIAGLGILFLLITPVRIAIAERRLESAVAHFREGRCGPTIEDSLAAIEALDSHPAPFELLGYCDTRTGQPELGVRMLRAAVRREPGSWELHYGLALVRAAAGRDPRPALRRARRLNPLEPLIGTAIESLDSDRPAVWRRESRELSLVIPGD